MAARHIRRFESPVGLDVSRTAALAGPFEHPLDALVVKVILVPGGGGHEAVEARLGNARDDRGERIAILIGPAHRRVTVCKDRDDRGERIAIPVKGLVEQSGKIALEGAPSCAVREMGMERPQEPNSGSGSVGASGSGIAVAMPFETPKHPT
jgi:hypothetical protein